MKKLAKFSVIFLVLLLLLSCIMVIQIANSTWHIQILNPEGGGNPSLALDPDGNPHISYCDIINGDLKYAIWTGSAWDIQTVDQYVVDSCLVLDSKGNPSIGYIASGNFLYANWTGSTWSTQTIDTLGVFYSSVLYSSVSLALDFDGNPHICYCYREQGYQNTNINFLKYAYWNGTGWSKQYLDDGLTPSLAVDSNGNPHISYSGNTGLEYASWNGTSWSIQTVGQNIGGSSLVLDASGNPHISYSNANGLMYAKRTNTSWNMQVVDPEVSNPTYDSASDIALDSNGNPHICYCAGDFLKLKYSSWNGSAWNIQTIDPDGGLVEDSLALDSNDNPQIIYSGHSGLKYASKTLWSPIETGIYAVLIGLVIAVVVLAVLLLLRKRQVRKAKNNSPSISAQFHIRLRSD
jgi:hypothetical protein